MPIGVPVLARQVVVTDLAAPMLAEPISQQSGAGAALYLMRQPGAGASTVCGAVCHHDPDHLHPGPLATVGMAFRPHPRLPVSTVPTPHRQHVPAGPAAGAGLAVPPRLGDTPRSVQLAGAALPAGGRQHQAGQPHVSADVPVQTDGCEEVKTSLAPCQVAQWSHLTTGLAS